MQESFLTVYKDSAHTWRNSCGQLHRTDGAAVITADGYQAWYLNGQLHRTDGAAVIYSDGSQQWWLNGCDLTKEVATWITARGVSWPWDESTQVEFVLTWS